MKATCSICHKLVTADDKFKVIRENGMITIAHKDCVDHANVDPAWKDNNNKDAPDR